MPKKKQKSMEPLPTHTLLTAEGVRKLLDIDEVAILQSRINEIANIIWRPEGLSKQEKDVTIARAIDHFNSLKPTDGAEGMLAEQMVGSHFAAMECLRRAALPNQTFDGRDMALKHAHKLMSLYAKQLETLNKHRGKGQQKVTVEHIRVEKGGQAIVGNVEAGNAATRTPDPSQLEHKAPDTVPLEAGQELNDLDKQRK